MTKKYSVIYADPPWQHGNQSSNGNAQSAYRTMSLRELKRLPVEDIAADDCVLIMWWCPPMPVEALELVEAWGFKLKNMNAFSWMKVNKLSSIHIGEECQRISEVSGFEEPFMGGQDVIDAVNRQLFMGAGNYTRGNTECALIATRGNRLERIAGNVKQARLAPVSKHSAKPVAFREDIDRLYGNVNKLEMFARSGPVEGWDFFGNQADDSLSIINAQFMSTVHHIPEEFSSTCAVCGRTTSHPEGWHYCHKKED